MRYRGQPLRDIQGNPGSASPNHKQTNQPINHLPEYLPIANSISIPNPYSLPYILSTLLLLISRFSRSLSRSPSPLPPPSSLPTACPALIRPASTSSHTTTRYPAYRNAPHRPASPGFGRPPFPTCTPETRLNLVAIPHLQRIVHARGYATKGAALAHHPPITLRCVPRARYPDPPAPCSIHLSALPHESSRCAVLSVFIPWGRLI
jgi:hypothetical protein